VTALSPIRPVSWKTLRAYGRGMEADRALSCQGLMRPIQCPGACHIHKHQPAPGPAPAARGGRWRPSPAARSGRMRVVMSSPPATVIGAATPSHGTST
jgi:hypothetical protein